MTKLPLLRRVLAGVVVAFASFGTLHPNLANDRPLGPFSSADQPCLQASQVLDLTKTLASGSEDSYSAAARLVSTSSPPGSADLTAFEENRSFVYAVGRASPKVIRRLIILKPSTFVVDDEAVAESSAGAARALTPCSGLDRDLVTISTHSKGSRSLAVLYARVAGQARVAPQSEVATDRDRWELTVAWGDKVFRLVLPPPNAGAGEISISGPSRKASVKTRPFPSGILPHGREGNKLLERWDADYHGPKPPAWDIGHPADELQKFVKGGTVHAGRVVDLGCGSGTDAIFLASHGFEVTAIDISPTAIQEAEEKARQAGVAVKWLLADVLAPPDIGQFDLLYDRGCYHNVRDEDLAAYITAVRRLSRPGTKFLLLSARREDQSPAGALGVTEEELRYDFMPLFDVKWLREIILETNEPGIRPRGWAGLLIRTDSR